MKVYEDEGTHTRRWSGIRLQTDNFLSKNARQLQLSGIWLRRNLLHYGNRQQVPPRLRAEENPRQRNRNPV